MTIAQKIFLWMDITIRCIGLLSIVPLLPVLFFLAIMASDSPRTSGLSILLVFGGVGILITSLILFSSLKPEMLTKPFLRESIISLILGRLPSYLSAIIFLIFMKPCKYLLEAMIDHFLNI
jgi:hypothetical protein